MSELQTDADSDYLSEKLKELWVILYSKGNPYVETASPLLYKDTHNSFSFYGRESKEASVWSSDITLCFQNKNKTIVSFESSLIFIIYGIRLKHPISHFFSLFSKIEKKSMIMNIGCLHGQITTKHFDTTQLDFVQALAILQHFLHNRCLRHKRLKPGVCIHLCILVL